MNLIFYILMNIFSCYFDFCYLKKNCKLHNSIFKQLSILNKIPQSNALRYFRLNNK